ncbi:MAG: rRNA adenine N(6)-methyltransferase family protein [Chloroflexota bacterium]|nr:rRNA adenine N(6)-methyltransferase family protein [Chloroflexota bacterium]
MRRIDPRVTHRRPELSQHYLRDATVARSLVRRMRLPPGALVVEPGAGDGRLTAALADAGHRVVAIEMDAELHARLRARFAGRANIECVRADFIEFGLPSTPYCVASNVPYSITAAVMRKLLHAARPPDVAALIVQREAAQKFAGAPCETLFALLHKPWFEIEVVATVPRRDFAPPPRVHSALLRIERRAVPLVAARDAGRYRSLTSAAFTYGLWRALRRELTPRHIKRLARDHRFATDAPASHLSFSQWLAIFRFVEHECLGHDPTLRMWVAA